MEAIVNSIFFRSPVEPVELSLEKSEAPVLSGDLFRRLRNLQANISMSMDPQDGNKYTLLLGCFIDGTEAAYVTDWIRNDDPIRARDYTFDIARYAKYTNPKKVHSVEIKLGKRKTLQYFRAREYDLYDSETYYYRVGAAPSEG